MYVKLFESILDSSIWDEDHATVRVWLTLLLMKNREGVVRASTGGVAARARVTHEETRLALQTFQEPDPESKNQDFGGRRIEPVDGGWLILNSAYYQSLQTRKQEQDAERQRRWRDSKRDKGVTKGDVTPEVEVKVDPPTLPSDAKASTNSPQDVEKWPECGLPYIELMRSSWEPTADEMRTNVSILKALFRPDRETKIPTRQLSPEFPAAIQGLPMVIPNGTRPNMRHLYAKNSATDVFNRAAAYWNHYQSKRAKPGMETLSSVMRGLGETARK